MLRKNKWRRQWSNLTWQINRLQCINISRQIVGMNGGWCGWKSLKRNIIILLRIQKVRATRCKYFVFWSTAICLDWNGLELLQYSISKHGAWPIAFIGWNWAKTNRTGLIYKHLWHFPMDGHVWNIFLQIPIKVRCTCTSKINQMKQYRGF